MFTGLEGSNFLAFYSVSPIIPKRFSKCIMHVDVLQIFAFEKVTDVKIGPAFICWPSIISPMLFVTKSIDHNIIIEVSQAMCQQYNAQFLPLHNHLFGSSLLEKLPPYFGLYGHVIPGHFFWRHLQSIL